MNTMTPNSRLPLVFIATFACSCGAPTVPTVPSASAGAPTATTAPPPADLGGGGAPSPKAREGTRLFVREQLADCEGEGPMKCLQVRESEAAEWTLLYSPIQGFDYEEGHAYELRVGALRDAEPPADAPAMRYRLLEIVSKRKVR